MVPYENIMGNEIQDIKFFIPADYNNIISSPFLDPTGSLAFTLLIIGW